MNLVESIKQYDWKWLLELFYGVGAAATIATAYFVIQNNPFDQAPTDFDTFQEWKTWGVLALVAGGRAAWQAASFVTVKIAEKVVSTFTPATGEE